MPHVGLLVPYLGTGSQAGFYNCQEVGIAKALVSMGHSATIFRCYDTRSSPPEVDLGDKGIGVVHVPAKPLGSHGLFKVTLLERFRLDRLILMADVQAIVPWVDRWASKRSIPLVPYIGTLESDKGRRDVLSLSIRTLNMRVFRRRHCFVKTPSVLQVLRDSGVGRVTLMPVGLDRGLLDHGLGASRSDALLHLGLEPQGRVAAFVGRLMPYKCPLGIVPILEELRRQSEAWRIIVVGDGPLRTDLEREIEAKGLKDSVTIIPKIPQSDMWQVYRAADVLVNLNPQEIFGMCILESLYYGTPVVAVDAPGPRFIIREGMDGYVVGPDDPRAIASALVRAAEERETLSGQAHQGIIERFDWRTNIERSGILEAG